MVTPPSHTDLLLQDLLVLERLLEASSRLSAEQRADELLRIVAGGVREALGREGGRPPSPARLRALRIFAGHASSAIASAAQRQELRFLADHDPLTRLLNRRAFAERLDAEVAKALRYGHSFGLVLCDLDGLKALNDRDGHPAGDVALQRFAATLCEALRKGDEAFRIGGDEFALLLAEATEEAARGVVQRVLDERDGLRASFGVASCPGDAREAAALFRLADEALYEAKRSGSALQFVA